MKSPSTFRPALALAAVLAAGCADGQSPTATGYMELPADQVMVGVTQSLESNGVRAALLRSDTVYMYNDSAKSHLRGVDLTLFDEDGAVSSTLTSLSGEINQRTDAMVARGTVVLVTENGERRIETEELHYDPQSKRVWTNVPFVMHHQGAISRGTAFESDDQFRNFRVTEARGRIEGLRFDF
jgi:LPS export ABC transporter protein LptC